MFFQKDITVLRILFLRLMALIYFFAFTSIYIQIPYLWGKNGLLPQQWHLNIYEERAFSTDYPDQMSKLIDQFTKMPTLLWLFPYLRDYLSFFQSFQNQEFESLIHILNLLGAFLSLFIFTGFPKFLMNSFSFLILFLLYLSQTVAGQTFMSFQWDILMCEAGFLCIFFAPMLPMNQNKVSPTDYLVREAIKFLIFKLMIASGFVKIQSNCPTWLNLTALHHHFASQPIPHVLSWFFHQQTDIMKKYGVVGTYIIENYTPFLFYSPFRLHRIFASLVQIFFMLSIIASGNYNFFNMLTIVLDMILLDDEFLYQFVPGFVFKFMGIRFSDKFIKGQEKQKQQSTMELWNIFSSLISFSIMVYLIYYAFFILFPYNEVEKGFLNSQVLNFVNQPQNIIIPALIYIFGITIAVILEKLFMYITDSNVSIVDKLNENLKLAMYLGIIGSVYLSSSFIFMHGVRVQPSDLHPKIAEYGEIIFNIQQLFHITNSYGLFRRMTGVNGRPELIIKGSQDQKKWKEYTFYNKVGPTDQIPPFIMPHQPRFEWQTWFSALSPNINHELFLVHFLYKLFKHDQHALALIQNNPFIEQPPKFLKVELFHYNLTYSDTKIGHFDLRGYIKQFNPFKNETKDIKFGPSKFWKRQFIVDWLPVVDKNTFAEFIGSVGLDKFNKEPNKPVHSMQNINLPLIFVSYTGVIFILNLVVQLRNKRKLVEKVNSTKT